MNHRWHLLLLLVILPLVSHLWFYYDLPLATDEIFYWSMAIFPSLGYYNHAPLVAWLLIPLTWIGDVPALQIRLMATIFTIATNLVLLLLLLNILSTRKGNSPATGSSIKHLLTPDLLSHPAVYIFAWVSLISPVNLIAGTIWTTDAPLFLFASLCFLTFYRAYKKAPSPSPSLLSSIRAWLPCGICFGLALLSKYTAVLWGGSAFLYLLYSKQGRQHLSTPGPWVAMLLSFAFLAPVIIWNMDKGWVSFLFIFQHGLAGGPPNTLLLIVGMLILLSPVLAYVVLRSHWLKLRQSATKSSAAQSDDLTWLLFITYMPLAFFFFRSFSSETFLNWVGLSCLTLMLLFSLYASNFSIFTKKVIYWHSACQLLIIGAVVYLVAVNHPSIRTRITSYEGLTPHIEKLEQSHPQAYLYGDSYGMHAILCRLKNEPLPYRYSFGYNNHFDYIDEQLPLGADILLFSFSSSGYKRYAEFFDEIQPLEAIEIINKGVVNRKVYPFLATNNRLGLDYANSKQQ